MTDKPQPVAQTCLQDGPLTEDGCPTTCLLWRNHDGPHDWTRDDEIGVILPPGERYEVDPALFGKLRVSNPNFLHEEFALYEASRKKKLN